MSLKFKISDHFNGKKFFNPAHPETPRFVDLIKLLTTYDPTKWPKDLQNLPREQNLPTPQADEVVMTFVNHATVLIQLPGVNIITDPVFSKRVSPVSFAGPKRARPPGVELEELPRIDVVLISHNHYDHLDLAAVKRLQAKFKPVFFVPLGDKPLLLKNGLTEVHELDWWDRFKFKENLEIVFTPTQHFSGRSLFDRNKTLWGGYVLSYSGGQKTTKIYFGGDAAYSVHYKQIRERLGVMDVSLIPIGAYEPRWFMSAVHMNPEEAVQAHLDLESQQSIGIHFGTFQLTEEAIDQPIIDLSAALKARSLEAQTFITLAEGQSRVF